MSPVGGRINSSHGSYSSRGLHIRHPWFRIYL